ncbi:MAG TPA: hypothetical protein VKD91_08350, partial [Pyrinomonadaceae bacterium]|nr:hypothetical protein [Pyrinomonadaceae bacterium]
GPLPHLEIACLEVLRQSDRVRKVNSHPSWLLRSFGETRAGHALAQSTFSEECLFKLPNLPVE